MLQELIEDIKIIINDIYKKTYDLNKNNLEDEDLKEFIASIRYYELIIEEIENKDSYENLENVKLSLISIKKTLHSAFLAL